MNAINREPLVARKLRLSLVVDRIFRAEVDSPSGELDFAKPLAHIADSLDRVHFAMVLEEEFKVTINDATIEDHFKTLNGVVTWLAEHTQ